MDASASISVKGFTPLVVIYQALTTLHTDPRNPHTHKPREIRSLVRSIKSFGFVVPILVDQNDQVIAGHARLEAAKSLDLPQVPVIRLEHLSAQQAQALVIADNRFAELLMPLASGIIQ